MGIQAWYTDLFECGAYKYIYRLNLGNVTDENSGKCMLPVKKKFVKEDSLKPVLKKWRSLYTYTGYFRFRHAVIL